MDNRVVQVELDVEELHIRVSQLEKILSDLAAWTGFKGENGTIEGDEERSNTALEYSSKYFAVDNQNQEDEEIDVTYKIEVGAEEVGFQFQEEFKVADYTLLKGDDDGVATDPKNDPDCTVEGVTGAKIERRISKKRKPRFPKKLKKASKSKCQKCLTGFNSTRGLKIHKATMHTVSCFMCPDAPQFPNSLRLRKHVRKVHPSNHVFSCPHCPEVFKTKQYLKQHVESHLPCRTENVDDENSEISGIQLQQGKTEGVDEQKQYENYEIVENDRTTTKRFKCSHCPSSYNFNSLLVAHLRKHTGERPFKCPQDNCEYAATMKQCLQIHLRKKHGIGTIPYKAAQQRKKTYKSCPICPKVFTTKQTLQWHVNTHTGAKPHGCGKCPAKYAQRPNLVTHMKTCRGGDHLRQNKHRIGEIGIIAQKRKKTYKSCPICPKVFTTKQSLQWHVNSHTGAKPHGCDKCPAKYAQRPNLIKHQKTCRGTENLEEIITLE